jgi:serine/threonine protein kinase/tetratricopeptide (TPR) repeat protein
LLEARAFLAEVAVSKERHARAKELFLAACRRPSDARNEFLEQSCGDDEGLLREVQSLLAHHEVSNTGDSSAQLPDEFLDPDADAARPFPQMPPRKIGPYRALQKIGEGGMGEVYEAEQLKPVRRRVALKLIKWGMETKEVVARFESERQALALMNHPSIASVFDAGATEEGRPYFVMEYVPGEPVTEYCDRYRLTVGERLQLFRQICDGVQHAHQKGIIHRDLKPSNILITVLDQGPVPKIIDFGVAKATSQHLTERTVYTEFGQWIGTPEYMSPEQAEGTGLDIDTRTDVYSLGVVLYELLAGAQPFDPDELRRAGFEGIRRILREEEPPKPSLRVHNIKTTSVESAKNRRVGLPALESALSGDLDWITMKALEKDRTRRYGSPSELAADIGRHLRNEPVLARPPSMSYQVTTFVRRHRLGVTAAALMLVTLLVGVIGTTFGLLEAKWQRNAAKSARDTAEHEAAKAQAINQFLLKMLASASPMEGLGRDATILDALDVAASRVGETFADQPEIEAAVQHTIGRIYLELGRYEEAGQWLSSALKMRQSILGPAHEEVAENLTSLGELALYWKNDPDAAEARFREALTLQRTLLGEDHLDVAKTLKMLALAQRVSGDYEEATRLIRESLAIERKVTGSESPSTLQSLAVLEHYGGDYEAAEAHFRKALDTLGNNMGDRFGNVAGIKSNLASLLHDKGDDRGAETLFRESLATLLERLGGAHIAVSAATANLAMTLVSQGSHDEGQRLYEEAIASFPEVLTRELPHYAQRRIVYGVLLTRRGRYEEAGQHLRAGLETYRARYGPEDERTQRAASHLVELYEAWGKPEEEAAYRAPLEKLEEAKQ